MKLEICAGSYKSALIAQEAGADRIELCENLNEGGTTPSFGTLQLVKENITIDINVLIRPRSGDFLYTESEFEIMKEDVLFCKKLGFNGVVIGILLFDGSIDIDRTKTLVQLAKPMSVTFHRAFDVCNNPETALEAIIEAGCDRLLTSGLKNTAIEGSATLKQLIEQANDRIIIMPGSGVKSTNIKFLKELVPAIEWHASAKSIFPSQMEYHNPAIENMGSDIFQSDPVEIKSLLQKLNE
ncbi:copper homeostasis protein CutC [Albibacterium indicum]|uniref:copper homeostasis protein CutC n=1 Tax=Albibacterium indicum TaxID=2292082 RepID=UPI000E5501C1|nr:copper homeostasis protein CutC [Pedobacter indicus]